MGYSISIAMCTYNGEAYLKEQLDSISNQSVLPNEIIICDDGSIDGTVNIIKKFQETSSVKVKLVINTKKLGPAQNFEQAIGLCTGDIIFCSDQDDYWIQKKIEIFLESFIRNPECGYIFSDLEVVDEEKKDLGYSMWEKLNFVGSSFKKFNSGTQLPLLINKNVITGAAMAIRRESIPKIFPIPPKFWMHDEWIAFILSAADHKGLALNKKLVLYRQHEKNFLGGKKEIEIGFKKKALNSFNTEKAKYLGKTQKYEYAKKALLKIGSSEAIKSVKTNINPKIVHFQRRYDIYTSNIKLGLLSFLNELFSFRYFLFDSGIKSIAKDAVILLKKKNDLDGNFKKDREMKDK